MPVTGSTATTRTGRAPRSRARRHDGRTEPGEHAAVRLGPVAEPDGVADGPLRRRADELPRHHERPLWTACAHPDAAPLPADDERVECGPHVRVEVHDDGPAAGTGP